MNYEKLTLCAPALLALSSRSRCAARSR